MQKAIPENRDLLQSRLLVWTVGAVLVFWLAYVVLILGVNPAQDTTAGLFMRATAVSLTFGLLVWALRAATPPAAAFGALISLHLTVWTSQDDVSLPHTALAPLLVLFLLTFLATRVGRLRKPHLTSARESRRGRNAGQVIANLGGAALLALGGTFRAYDWALPHAGGFTSPSVHAGPALAVAALVEATADTVSSELGQAFGGTPYLLTSLRPAPAGTDGAISLIGTVTGIAAATLVALTGAWSLRLAHREAAAALAGGVAGLFFDSILGATLERRGWLNNDLVNFSSTIAAGGIALALLAL